MTIRAIMSKVRSGITESDVVRGVTAEDMFNDIHGYLCVDGNVFFTDTEIESLRIKCNYWFEVAVLQGELNKKEGA